MILNKIELRSFFYGTLLGDSFMHNGSFSCKQISKDLMEFKKDIIHKNLPNAKISFKSIPASVRDGINRQEYWELWISGDPLLKEFQNLFYPNGRKIVPPGVISSLTPIGLAMLYADDGTTILVRAKGDGTSANNRRIQICTESFSLSDHQIIQDEMLKLGFQTGLVKRNSKGDVRLSLPVGEGQKFVQIIEPFFYNYFPSLLYKMDLGYRGESLKKRKYVSESYEKLFIKISAHPSFIDRCLKDDIV